MHRWLATDRLSRLTFGWLALLTTGAGAFALCVVCVLTVLTVQWFFSEPAAAEPSAATRTTTAERAGATQAARATTSGTTSGTAPSTQPAATRAPGSGAAPTATRPSAGNPPAATATPRGPAATPTATATATLTPTPSQTATPTATATPSPTPTPPGKTYDGVGKQTSARFPLTAGVAFFRIRYAGAPPLSIWLVGAGNAKVAPIVATAGGPYSGVRAVSAPAGADFALDVQGEGAWSINVYQPPPVTTGAKPPQSLNGEGDSVSAPLSLSGGMLTFKISYAGGRDLLIWLLDQSGSRVTLVTRNSGAYAGSLRVAIPEDNIYLLDVTASGPWTVDISP